MLILYCCVINCQLKITWICYLRVSVTQESGHALLGLLIRVGFTVCQMDVGWAAFSFGAQMRKHLLPRSIRLLAELISLLLYDYGL